MSLSRAVDVATLLVSVVSGIMLVALALLCVYWVAFDTAPPFTTSKVSLHRASGEQATSFKPGEVLLVRRNICFTKATPLNWSRQLISETVPRLNVHINQSAIFSRVGCVDNINVLKVPDETPPGSYRLSVVAHYSNNPFHRAAAELLPPNLTVTQ